MPEMIDIGTIDDIPRQGARVVQTQKCKIAVFRTGTDEIYAVHDKCPHKNGPLSQGIVHGKKVTCPLHSLIIDLSTGRALPPDEGTVPTIPVKIKSGRIILKV
jgi:nitrite reductase (NADH) small subunit